MTDSEKEVNLWPILQRQDTEVLRALMYLLSEELAERGAFVFMLPVRIDDTIAGLIEQVARDLRPEERKTLSEAFSRACESIRPGEEKN